MSSWGGLEGWGEFGFVALRANIGNNDRCNSEEPSDTTSLKPLGPVLVLWPQPLLFHLLPHFPTSPLSSLPSS